MGEFDESDDVGSVDTNDCVEDTSSDTQESVDDTSTEIEETEYTEQQTETEAETEAEYAEQQAEAQAEAEAEYTEQQAEAEANDLQSIMEQSEKEMLEAQAEAEAWADKNGMTEWSDGTPRANANIDESSNEYPEEISAEETDANEQYQAEEANKTEKEEEQRKIEEEEAREAEERAALEADVQAQGEALNKEYMDLMDKKNTALESTIDATNIEDRERFANLQHDIGEQMEQVRSKIIENNNRLK